MQISKQFCLLSLTEIRLAMTILYGSPVALSAMMIAAHFYRSQMTILALACLLSPFVMLLKRSWVPQLMTSLLALFAVEWIITMLSFIESYKAQNLPYVKLALILTSVIVFTLFSSLIFRTKIMKRRYQKAKNEDIWFIR